MASWDQVRRIALGLPETSERDRHGHLAWSVRDKVFAWERPLRKSDLEALGARAPKGAILAVRVEHLLVKEARLAARPDVCFTTPHFDGYPAILLRLGKAKVSDLRELLTEAWLAQVPKALARRYREENPT
ncbi:MAG TPA: hypothetical protein VFV75_06420 [Candidatus Polarisedimenticolaceae bacterium]|nr:hypothetical protein [Candidatus Polarisedimenticolaceae bacterium]